MNKQGFIYSTPHSNSMKTKHDIQFEIIEVKYDIRMLEEKLERLYTELEK